MEQIKNSADLTLAISKLESIIKEQEDQLKVQFELTFESLKPVSIIKNTFDEIVSSSKIKKDLSTITIGMITGFIAKKVVIGKTSNPISNWASKIFEMMISSETMKRLMAKESINEQG